MTGTNIQKWGSYEAETAEREKEESAYKSDFVKLKEGKHALRFLPPKLGEKTPFTKVWQHFIRLPGTEKPAVFNCPRMMAKSPCPACQAAEKLRASGQEKKAKAFYAKPRWFAVVIERAAEEMGPQILPFGKTVFDALTAIRLDEEDGGDFTNPGPDGFDIIITREGSGQFDTEYHTKAARSNSEIGDIEWLDQRPNTDFLSEIRTAEEISAMLRGEDPDEGQRRGRGSAESETRASAGRTQSARSGRGRRAAAEDPMPDDRDAPIDTDGTTVGDDVDDVWVDN